MEELCPYLDAQKQPMHNMKDTLSDKDVSPIRSFSSLDKYVYPSPCILFIWNFAQKYPEGKETSKI
jgi:hypothetical protein